LFSPDGRCIIAATQEPAGLLIVEMATGQVRQQIDIFKILPAWFWPPPVFFTPGGEFLLMGEGGTGVAIIDPLTGELLHRRQDHRGHVGRIVFSPSGRLMASIGGDTTILVWNAADFLRPARPKQIHLSDDELMATWDALASADAAKAALAIRQLTRAGEQAVSLLSKRLPAAKSVALDVNNLKQWLADLDDESFETRKRAEAEIEKLGEAARPALEKKLAGEPSPELRRTIERLTAKLDPARSPQLLQSSRAVEVLESIRTQAARDLLEKLAKGAAEARLTREAKASLDRLKRAASTRAAD
jgi:hypothetical protein